MNKDEQVEEVVALQKENAGLRARILDLELEVELSNNLQEDNERLVNVIKILTELI